VAGGSIAMDFDAAVFGDIANVAVFSATGDALGYANVSGRHVDAHFSSPSGGIGQLPGQPLFVVPIPLLAGAKAGTSAAVILDPSGGPWTDAQGNSYAVTVTTGAGTVGGLSVASVTPGGRILPAGSVLQIAGTGFDAITTVAIDGAAVAAVRFINSQQMEVTLSGATELTSKHFRLANGNGQMVDYFSAFPSAPPVGFTGPTGIFPLAPLSVFANILTDVSLRFQTDARRSLAMLNQTLSPVTVLRASQLMDRNAVEEAFTIPPGALYFLYTGEGMQITASAAVRMVEVIEVNPAVPDPSSVSVFTPTVTDNAPAPLETSLSQTDVGWSWQTGSPAPAAASIYMGASLGFTVTGSGVSWLSVTPAESTGPATLFLQPDLAQLAPGVYTTTALVTPTVPAGLPAYPVMPTVISISVTVSAAPLISASVSYMDFSALFPIGSAVAQSTLKLGSNGQPAAFTVVARTTSGGQWLSVTPSSGTAPATLTVTANRTGLGSGIYGGDLAIQGPGNTLHVMVNLTIFPLPGPPAPSGLATSPEVLVFYLPAGAAAPASSATDLRAAGGRLRSGFGANGNRHGVA
jgi:hypothetical protein